ncbi:hypothetical protein KSP40_PGU001108 [Platanthera guangdongensis]|uniref:Uncharacterized protein n=1 Tax=Platanthera guangdongensis TaxID=2320717 RepID=A0ABR2LW55_9ASPA
MTFFDSGRAAITRKNELERINEESLGSLCSQLREAMDSETTDTPDEVLGMDWSRRPEVSINSMVDEFGEQSSLVSHSSFIFVHGAGLRCSFSV